ncbi:MULTISPECIES: hydroxyethylthiazole kinase [unclassified Brevibacterium]|uniref:hydroxyethylthiazole kinase n=1 Tax=unclassified Brevibacterium TaxID=2614124 RepID=UPI0010F63CA6|nr:MULTISPECIES: hydroxyethylthiazole kinase [unclassified Brevibacterium]MCM1011636.1 hydroxyethylthiazole kinase [Brevibacterium sp. XM4083]
MTDIDLSSAHARLRAANPLIQCITNTVVQQFSANVLLAVGASPAMLDHEADAAQFAHLAGGLLVNFGTATNQQFLAADAAIGAVTADSTPWVLDPVSIGAVDHRTTRIRRAAADRPTAIRGNASEIAALAGAGAGGRGVESTDEVDAVLPAAAELARTSGAIVAVSGRRDAIVAHIDGVDHIARVDGGHEFMPLVIGTGCSLGAVTSAYLAAVPPAGSSSGAGPAGLAAFEQFTAVVAAHAHFAVAGEAAAAGAAGPGSYAEHFLDALYTTDDARIGQARVEVTRA